MIWRETRRSAMAVTAVADAFNRAFGLAGVLVEAVLDGVPGNRHSDEFLGGLMDFVGS